ncbi:MAG: cytochrome c biogenesis protein CcsA [Bacteroidia bacterium]
MKWWKYLSVLFLIYVLVAAFLMPVPQLPILEQSIRNLYFHVPMWFGMILLLMASAYNAIKHLSAKNQELTFDFLSSSQAVIAMLFGIIGLATGMIWAKNTWGTYWTNDPKLNSAAIGMLMYAAYFVLRSSIVDEEKRARISAVYNIFCLPVFVVLIFVLPRLTDSLHPGNGGNPGFSSYDLDSRMRMVFYPAVLGWTLLGFWLANIYFRFKKINNQLQ